MHVVVNRQGLACTAVLVKNGAEFGGKAIRRGSRTNATGRPGRSLVEKGTAVSRVYSWCLVALLAMFAWSAHAQDAPRPVEFYFDEDRLTIRPYEPVALESVSDGLIQGLLRQRLSDRRAIEQVGRIAHTAIANASVELGEQLYARALSDIGVNHGSYRQMLWNFARDLQRAGQHEAAFQRWSELISARAVRGSWMPPTMALSSWQAGHRELALEWYAAAVRTHPQRWAEPGDFSALLPDWRPAERAILGEVHAAWLENPPSWP